MKPTRLLSSLGASLLLTASSLSGAIDLQPALAASCTTWNAAADFRVPPTQANPGPDSCGNANVWYYMQSTSLAHTPSTYISLGSFISDSFFIPNFLGWQGTNISTSIKDALPAVRFNTTGSTQHVTSSLIVPPVVVDVHPFANQYAIVGWRSPVAGAVNVMGGVTDLDAGCGNGIYWSIDRNATTLSSGAISNGGQQRFSAGTGGAAAVSGVNVAPGDFLYFMVGPGADNDYGCDSTQLDVTITLAPDLLLSASVTPGTAQAGTPVLAAASLTNTATVSRMVTLSASLTYTTVNGTTKSLSSLPFQISIAAGQTIGSMLPFQVPVDLPAGTYNMVLNASDVTGSVTANPSLTIR